MSGTANPHTSAESEPSTAEYREDYAEEAVPKDFRTWTNGSLFGVMFGVTTAMIFLSTGGVLVRAYGTQQLLIGMIVSTVVLGGLSMLFSYRASRTGLGAELLTRGAGFGFLGSIPTTLIYAFAMIMYFAFEGGIMVNAISSYFAAIPKWAIIVVAGAIFIPLALYGMKLMNIVMWVTLPFYLVFMLVTIIKAAGTDTNVDFWSYEPAEVSTAGGPVILQLLAVAMAYGTQVAVSADTGRFIRPEKARSGAFIVGGLSQVLVFIVCIMLGAWLALQFEEADPGIYLPGIMGIWGVLFVVVTQLRINVVNAYASSIGLSNIISRVFKTSPGRHVWVVVSVILGMIAMLTDLYGHIAAVMTFASIFLLAWIVTVFADALWVRWIFKMVAPDDARYRRGEIYDFNPVGLVSVLVAIVVAVPFGLGATGPFGVTIAPYIAAVIPLILVPILAKATKGKYYGIPNTEPAASPGVAAGD